MKNHTTNSEINEENFISYQAESKEISQQTKINWLRLARSENVGPITFFQLIKKFGSVENVLENFSDFSQKISTNNSGRKINLISETEAEKEFEKTEKFGAEIIIFNDPNYPKLFKELTDAPPLITVKGDLDFLNRNALAIVGSRNASSNGISFTKEMAIELGQHSIVTVSGMARGIDAAVHQSCLLSGTVGIIAGGINHVYPIENQKLYESVAATGLLISESPFDSTPQRSTFVQRNRLISGLSLGVVVVEAGLKSGSLTTARFAAEQGRDVFVVPGYPFDPKFHGSNQLIKDGAYLVESIEDILVQLPNLRTKKPLDLETINLSSESFFNEINKTLNPAAKTSNIIPSNIDVEKARQEIVKKLSYSPLAIEDLIEQTQIPSSFVNIALMQLEIAGHIELNSDKVFLKA